MPRTLFIDASTPTLFIGAYENDSWLKLLRRPQSQTMETLFEMATELFAAYPLDTMSEVCLCEGPGRLMSLRIVATAANQWATPSKERLCFNSLALLSTHLSTPTAYELRKGTHVLYDGNTCNIIDSATLPPAAALLHSAVTPREDAHASYDTAVEAFPSLAARLTQTSALFNPPLYAPLPYALAKNEAISKES